MAKRNKVARPLTAVILVSVMVFTLGCVFKIDRGKEPVTMSEMTVAGLRLGMTGDQVTEILGHPLSADSKGEPGDVQRIHIQWEYEGLTVFLVTTNEEPAVLYRVTVTANTYKLPSGLKIGSQQSRVLDAYAKDEQTGIPLTGFDAEMQLIDYHENELRKSIAYGLTSASFVYQNLSNKSESGSGTAYLYESESGSIINYNWSNFESSGQLSFVFDMEGNVIEYTFSNTDDTPYYNQKPVKSDDMEFGEIKLGLTRDEVRAILGEPTKIEDSDDLEENLFVYGHYFNWYYGDDLILNLYQFDGILTAPYQLGSVWSQSKSYQLPSGLTVGDKFIKVIEAYAQDNHFGEKVIGGDGEPFGYYLYGGVTTEDFETLPLTNEVGTAYVNIGNGDGIGRIEYNWYPVGSYGFEKSYSLIFDLDMNKIVTGIRFYYHSMMDPPQEAQ